MIHLSDDMRTIPESLLESAPATDDRPSIETAWRALSAPGRVDALVCLLSADEPLTVEALASAVASRGATDRDTGTLTVSLYHRDLPMLAEAGLVAFDPREDRVAPTTAASAIASAASGLAAEPAER